MCPDEPTRFDHDLTIDDGEVARTNRFERMFQADLNGLFSALIQGFTLDLKGSPSGHLYAALMNPGEPMMWGNFSGFKPAVYSISEAFREQYKGELLKGPPAQDPTGIDRFLLEGGTSRITREEGAYRVELWRKLGLTRRRQGARMLNLSQLGVRRSHAEDLFEAINTALEKTESVEEIILL